MLKKFLNSLITLFTYKNKFIVTNYFEEIFATKINTKELCIGKTDEKTCLSQDQVDKLIELLSTPEPANNENPTPTAKPTPEATESATP